MRFPLTKWAAQAFWHSVMKHALNVVAIFTIEGSAMATTVLMWLLLGGIVVVIGVLIKRAEKRERELFAQFIACVNELKADPLNETKQQVILAAACNPLLSRLPLPHSGYAYQVALECLASNPDECRARTFALSVGRWHRGRCRPDGLPTIYDEQAIQNDILARSQVSATSLKQLLAVGNAVE